mmetsp:Transcript_61242/g.197325  ORF Transcript_61242/g.197325 Transcript_61242/m.197325 type:complete len:366 (+) Transcript_61242:120-1217(+)
MALLTTPVASDHDSHRCCAGLRVKQRVASFAAHTAVEVAPRHLDVASVAPVGRPAVADRVVVRAVLVGTVADEDNGVIDLGLVVPAGLHLQHAAVIEEHLVRHHDADREGTLAHQRVEDCLLIPGLDVRPARDLRTDFHEPCVPAVTVDGEVAPVGHGGRDNATVLAHDLQHADVGVAAVAAEIARATLGAIGPGAVQKELLRQGHQPAGADCADGLDGLRGAVGPAGAAHGLVLHGAHHAGPFLPPVQARRQGLGAIPVGAHERQVLRRAASIAERTPGLAALEAQHLLARHVQEAVAAEARRARVTPVELLHEAHIPLEDPAAHLALCGCIGLAVLPEEGLEKQRLRFRARSPCGGREPAHVQ